MAFDLSQAAKYVEQAFPQQIDAPGHSTLARSIILMDSSSANAPLLPRLLRLLDKNLGPKYASCSRLLYHNTKTWQENKLEEMQSQGLVYVVYSQNEQPQLFLSFMICEEYDVIAENDQHQVLYLYEIQICAELQGKGLGTRLIRDHLIPLIHIMNENMLLSIRCIELTVFSDNNTALKLYQGLGAKLTFGSPKSASEDIYRRVTRSQIARISNRSTTDKAFTRTGCPVYFILYILV